MTDFKTCPEWPARSTASSLPSVLKQHSLFRVENSRMAVPVLLLLQAACVFSMGVGLWVVCNHFLTAEIPAAIGHPMRLRVLHCIFELLVTWVSGVFYLSCLLETEGGSWENTLRKIVVALMLLSQAWRLIHNILVMRFPTPSWCCSSSSGLVATK